MGFSEEMTNMGQNFVKSFDQRVHDVKDILNNTHRFLGKTRADHRNMARKQRQFLNQFADGLSEDTGGLLKRFHSIQKEMAKKQAQFLKKFTDNNSEEVGDFLDDCYKKQKALHNMFRQAHNNFVKAMKEIARNRASAKFPKMSAKGNGHFYAAPKLKPKKREMKQKRRVKRAKKK